MGHFWLQCTKELKPQPVKLENKFLIIHQCAYKEKEVNCEKVKTSNGNVCGAALRDGRNVPPLIPPQTVLLYIFLSVALTGWSFIVVPQDLGYSLVCLVVWDELSVYV